MTSSASPRFRRVFAAAFIMLSVVMLSVAGWFTSSQTGASFADQVEKLQSKTKPKDSIWKVGESGNIGHQQLKFLKPHSARKRGQKKTHEKGTLKARSGGD